MKKIEGKVAVVGLGYVGLPLAVSFAKLLTVVGFDIKTAQYGWPLGMPLIRKLEPGLWEVRSHIGDGIAHAHE